MTISSACDEGLCELVQDTLVELGLRPLTECNGEWPCPNLLENAREIYHALTPEHPEPVLDLLQEMSEGKLPITASRELLKEDPFPCPELGVDIYQPCRVRSCEFNIDHSWSRNCIVYYRIYKETTKLTIEELELLLKRNRAEISKILKTTMKKLRHAALKETISQDAEDTIIRIDPPDICVVCENTVEKPFRRTTRYIYCGDQCYLFKPPYIIDLEKEFNLPIFRLLNVCVNTFRASKAISQALGITPSKLTLLCNRYGIPLPE
jgi:hypothetical protein